MRRLVAVLALTGCVHNVTEMRSHSVKVETEPDGAYVSVVEGDAERNLGRAPVTAELGYTAEHQEFDGSCWAMPAAAVGVAAGGVALAAATWNERQPGPAALGVSLASLAVSGLIYSSLYCAIAQGTLKQKTYPRTYLLRARLAGHETQTVNTEVPRRDTERILLVPLPENPTPPATPAE